MTELYRWAKSSLARGNVNEKAVKSSVVTIAEVNRMETHDGSC